MNSQDDSQKSPETNVKVKVKILEREYHILCPPSDEDNLRSLITFLESRFNDLKATYPHSDNEQIVVLYALNLLKKTRLLETKFGSVQDRIQTILFKVSE